jgi:hypothetical protein
VKKLRSCGHATKVFCSSADPEQEPCKRKCKKTLECGHDCIKLCSDDCSPCTTKVLILPILCCCYAILLCVLNMKHYSKNSYFNKVTKSKSCGHSLDYTMCHEDVEAVACKKRCFKALPCGHRCTNSCDEECSTATECAEMVKFLYILLYCACVMWPFLHLYVQFEQYGLLYLYFIPNS